MRSRRTILALCGALALAGGVLAACGDDDDSSAADTGDDTRAQVVVTTSILGDVVEQLAGSEVDVITIMGSGVDPHEFQPSARQVQSMHDADVLIVNGGNFEIGLGPVIDAVAGDGTPTFAALAAVTTLDFDGHAHGDDDDDHADDHADDHGDDHADDHADDHGDDHADDHGHDDDHADDHADDHGHDDDHADDHADDHGHDDDHADDHGHDHGDEDPHFFTDPARMVTVAAAIVDFLAENVDGIDEDALRSTAADYIGELEELDVEVEGILSAVPDDQRVLITNHEVFGYFADRYGFEVAGAVIPSGTTADGTSAARLADLARLIEAEGVRAVFADASASTDLADALAAEVGDVAVVDLFSEALGPEGSGAESYVGMVRTNAERIAEALS